MTYDRENFGPIGNTSLRGNSPILWGYQTADTKATVDTAGYFNDESDKLSVNDIILATVNTGGTAESIMYKVVSNASGVVDVNDGFDIDSAAGQLVALNVQLTDISTAGQSFVVSPVAGTVTRVDTVLNGAVGTADETLTVKDDSGSSMGTITLTSSGSAAGDKDSLIPAANNTVSVGDKIEIETAGDSDTASNLFVTFTINPGSVDTD